MCDNPFPHTCTEPYTPPWFDKHGKPEVVYTPGHDSCSYRYVASINQSDFEALKDARLTK